MPRVFWGSLSEHSPQHEPLYMRNVNMVDTVTASRVAPNPLLACMHMQSHHSACTSVLTLPYPGHGGATEKWVITITMVMHWGSLPQRQRPNVCLCETCRSDWDLAWLSSTYILDSLSSTLRLQPIVFLNYRSTILVPLLLILLLTTTTSMALLLSIYGYTNTWYYK